MSETTSRFGIPFPSRHADPWYEDFLNFATQLDAELFALHEDRNLAAIGGGTVAWNATTGVLSWTSDIVFVSPTFGVRMILAAGSSAAIADGQFANVTLTRGAVAQSAVTLSVAQAVDVDGSEKQFAYRSGTKIYLFTGLVLDDGDSTATGIAPGGGGGGGGGYTRADHPTGLDITAGYTRYYTDQELQFGDTGQVAFLYFDSGGGFDGLALNLAAAGMDSLFLLGGLQCVSGVGTGVERGGTGQFSELMFGGVKAGPGFGTGGDTDLYGLFLSFDNTGTPLSGSAKAAMIEVSVEGSVADTGGGYAGFTARMNANPGSAFASAFNVIGVWDLAADIDSGLPIRLRTNASFVDLKSVEVATKANLYADTTDGVVQLTLDGKPLAHMDRHFSLAAREAVANPDGTVAIGQIAFDGSRLKAAQGLTVYFDVIAAVTAAVTGTVQLYNLTDGEVVSTHSTIVSTAPTKYRNTVTVGSGVGELKLADKVYEVRASVTGSTAADILYVGQAYLRIEV